MGATPVGRRKPNTCLDPIRSQTAWASGRHSSQNVGAHFVGLFPVREFASKWCSRATTEIKRCDGPCGITITDSRYWQCSIPQPPFLQARPLRRANGPQIGPECHVWISRWLNHYNVTDRNGVVGQHGQLMHLAWTGAEVGLTMSYTLRCKLYP